jgi:peptide/nickel transport system substrate-binding protein
MRIAQPMDKPVVDVGRREFTLGALAVGALTWAPTTLKAAGDDPKKGGVLAYASVSGPGGLDPHVSSSAVELEVIHNVFESLVSLDNQNATKPMLAASATASADAKTYTFVLRRGVKFHNGAEMTSADVQASMERYGTVSPNKGNLAGVERYETPDPYTFIIHLKEPNVVLLDVMKAPVFPFMILPASQKDKPARGIDVIGTGPCQLGEWGKDSHLVIKRFDGYVPDTSSPGRDGYAGRKTVYLDAVNYRFTPEATTRVAALQTNEVQLASSIPFELRGQIESHPELAIREIFPLGGTYIIVNSQYGLTANREMRQAIAAAIDVGEISEAIGGINKPNPWMSYPNTPYYPGDKIPTPWYDQKNPDKAKEMAAKAGYKNEKLIIETNSNYQWMRSTMLVVAEQLKEAGFNVDVKIVDWTTNASHMQQGTGEWNLSTTLFGPEHILGPQQWRPLIYAFSNIKGNDALDADYKAFFSEPDLAKRVAIWVKIQDEVLGGGYMIKLADQGRLIAYAKTLKGQSDYAGILQLWDLWLG